MYLFGAALGFLNHPKPYRVAVYNVASATDLPPFLSLNSGATKPILCRLYTTNCPLPPMMLLHYKGFVANAASWSPETPNRSVHESSHMLVGS